VSLSALFYGLPVVWCSPELCGLFFCFATPLFLVVVLFFFFFAFCCCFPFCGGSVMGACTLPEVWLASCCGVRVVVLLLTFLFFVINKLVLCVLGFLKSSDSSV
jgi:hypothetical protein